MIEKPLSVEKIPPEPYDGEIIIEELDGRTPEEAPMVVEMEDGGVEVDFGSEEPESAEEAFASNLAEYMDDEVLSRLGQELVDEYLADLETRKEWEMTYKKGLDLLAIKEKKKTKPWDGAASVIYPTITKAVVDFQSQTISEIFPAEGPVKARLVGKVTPEKEQQAARVVEYMNYSCTERMEEFFPDTERMLFDLPVAGSGFKKTVFDPVLKRESSMFVPALDLIVAYGCSTLAEAERISHRREMSNNTLKKMQHTGDYRRCEISESTLIDNELEIKKQEMAGQARRADNDDHMIIEMCVDLDLEGYEHTIDDGYHGSDDEESKTGIGLPYVVSIDYESCTVLSIYRNWREGESPFERRVHYTHYSFVPGLGFYGLGYPHLIGGLAMAIVGILQQLIDAGTMANIPAGFKARGIKVSGGSSPLAPGEMRDVETLSDLKEAIMFLPTKEPSEVLYRLMQDLIKAAQEFISAGNVDTKSLNSEVPVGTVMAILERDLKTMSAIQRRVHMSFKQEMRLLHDVIGEYGEQYPYEVEDGVNMRSDFDGRVDVIPVTNPNAATMTQRILQGEAALQLSKDAPELYDKRALHRRALRTIGLDDVDDIVPPQDEMKPLDPVSEHMAMLTNKPVRAFEYQDHDAHLTAHLAVMEDPSMMDVVQKSPNAKALMSAFQAHIAEHLAFKHRHDVEYQLGVPMPAPGEPMPEDIEHRLSQVVSMAVEKLAAKNQHDKVQEEYKETLEDPVYQLQKKELENDTKELEIKEKKFMGDLKVAMQRLTNDMKKHSDKMKQQGLERKSDEKIAGVRAGIDIGRSTMPHPGGNN